MQLITNLINFKNQLNGIIPIILNKKYLNSPYLVFIFFTIGLAIRLIVNLFINPIESFLHADMTFYNTAANLLIQNPLATDDFLAFYPPGTSIILAFIKILFGINNFVAIEIIYALLDSFSIIFAYSIAKSVSNSKILPLIILVISTFNINAILFGSCLLSQTLHVFFMMLGLMYFCKYYLTKQTNNITISGIAFGIDILIRPEIFLFILLLICFYLIKYLKAYNILSINKTNYKINFSPILSFLSPIIIFIFIGLIKFYIHTGHIGLSHNGAFNFIFSRCHNTSLRATGNNLNIFFPHDTFIDLYNKNKPETYLTNKLNLQYNISENTASSITWDCISQTGFLTQAKYSLQNLMLLWTAPLWPLYKHPSVYIQKFSNFWYTLFDFYFVPLSILGLIYFLCIQKNSELKIIISLCYLSLLISSAIFFGDPRIAVPYQSIIALLSLEFISQCLPNLIKILKNKNTTNSYQDC